MAVIRLPDSPNEPIVDKAGRMSRTWTIWFERAVAAVSSRASKIVSGVSGNLVKIGATGDFEDSGQAVTALTGKVDKIVGGTVGRVVSVAAVGNIADSGKVLPSGVIVGTTDAQDLTNKAFPALTALRPMFSDAGKEPVSKYVEAADMAGLATISNVSAINLLSWIVDLNPYQFLALNLTGWQMAALSGSGGAKATLQTAGSQNDEYSCRVVLAGGTWTIFLTHVKGPDRGIYSLQLDGVEKGTVDGYAAAASYDAVGSVAGVVLAASGAFVFKVKMATKNASSSGYLGCLQRVRFMRTA